MRGKRALTPYKANSYHISPSEGGAKKIFEPEVVAEWLRKGRVWLAEDVSISVSLAHNNKGVGGLLLNVVFDWARDQARSRGGSARVSLFTYPDVPWNGKWYEKRGFKEVLPIDLGPEHIAKMDLDENSGA
ncbi:uncharacterized protein MYCFIDRAFT_174786 [Pseudocercospora fijiensis CIRAD86]|uniref:N-acetyltransferase domain-containing protein n=1 Tax=Pseudocercospora fijiensis (strain CIRAD86) TaxID=383855 RepID=M2Z0H2_PSEFD|nr:uncharacterized protein MYCFIDRAFT_174786 [Pseudocercospora fijiensis CIRAD86]EME83330.1 hypothetical protein MYCFIDRAFT_174786 [Pseudocercospora fijiensis CIRAD86]